MKRVLIVLSILFLAAACGRFRGQHSGDASQKTQTIAPASGQPAPSTGNDDALTQTTDVEDSRSEEDGGVTSPTAGATTTGTAPAKAPAKAPVKKKTKK